MSDNKVLLDNIESLMVQSQSTLHEVPVDRDNPNVVLRVWIRELSFLEVQDALKEVVDISSEGEINVDLASYWRYMLTKGVEKTEPSLSTRQILSLKSEVAALITALLPQPEDLVVGPLVAGIEE